MLVSILMPIYNGARYLSESIGSVIAQTYQDWELIALDDGSTDDSPAVLQELAARDSRIRIFHKENDPSGNVARNIALMCQWAKGDFAFYLSQDDTMAPDMLEFLIRRAIETDVDIVLPDMLLRFADNTTGEWPCSYPPERNYDLILSPREAFFEAVDFRIHGFGLVRMSLMADERNNTQFYDSDELNSRMQFLWSTGVAFSPVTFYYYQGNPDSITRKFHVRRFQRLRTHILLAEAFMQVFDAPSQRLRLMMQLVHTYIATAHLYFTHYDEMSSEERTIARKDFHHFEQHISFAGYRKAILRKLNNYERLFALCLFVAGSALPFRRCYGLLHR